MAASTGLYDTSTITYDQSSLSYDGYPAPLANLPAVGVYVAFTDGPYVAEPVWSDVSYLTRDVSIRRGRQDDLQQFPSGQCSITFDNRDRYFDPFNTSSPAPFNGNLKPRRQVKVVAVWNGVSYPLFRGFVAGWPVEYTEAGLDSTVTVDCFDLLTLLANEVIDANPLYDYMISLQPNHFFTLADVELYNETFSGSILTLRNSISPNYGTDAATTPSWVNTTTSPPTGNITGFGLLQEQPFAATPTFTTRDQSIIPSQITRSLSMLGGIFGVEVAASGATGATSGNFSFVVWFKHLAGNATSVIRAAGQTGSNFSITIGATGLLTASLGAAIAVTKFSVTDNVPHCAVLTVTGGTPALYIDGVNVGDVTGTGTATFGENLSYIRVGTAPVQAVYQHIALFKNRCLTATEVETIYNLGIGSRRETAGVRAAAYFADADIPSGLYSVDSTVDIQVDELPKIGASLLPELQLLNNSETGALFVDCTGVLQMWGDEYWSSRATSNTSQFTFTDTGTGVKYDAGVIRMAFDAETVRNKFTVNGSFGQSVDSADATSIADVGVAGEVLDTRVADSGDLQSVADDQLAIFKNPKLALEPFVAKGQQDPAYNWPLLLNVELLDRVTFKRTPSVGSAVQRDLLVQSVEHRITPGTWETVVNGSTRYTGWFIIGTSLLGSSEDVLL